jgi:L-asparaginase
MPSRPTLALIATGGTIAGAATSPTDTRGYVAGVVPADALIAAVPQIEDIATIRAETLFAIDSKDMTPTQWLQLAHRTRACLAEAHIDGVVITHGTDTMEESAHFLALTLASDKPVVLTGAMRPATALSADGPMNLHAAVSVAADPLSIGRGVVVCMGGMILPGYGLRKRDCDRMDAFAAFGGPLGRSAPAVRYLHPSPPQQRAMCELPPVDAPLARVDILHVGAGSAPDLADAAATAGAQAIVLALPGNGSLPDSWESVIGALVRRGVPVVRASRCGQGEVHARVTDVQLGTWPAGVLSPAAARIVLMLGLAACARAPALDLHACFSAASAGYPPQHG